MAKIPAGGIIVAPAGISENVEQFIAPTACHPGIAEHLQPASNGKHSGKVGVYTRP
jgi:hypothetical protein